MTSDVDARIKLIKDLKRLAEENMVFTVQIRTEGPQGCGKTTVLDELELTLIALGFTRVNNYAFNSITVNSEVREYALKLRYRSEE